LRENDTVYAVVWQVNPFRGDKFEEIWTPVARAAIDFGASSWTFFRSNDDPLTFMQMAVFESKLEWERYWLSEEVSEARAEASGLFQVPVLPLSYRVVGTGVVAPVAEQG
jgi:hypothetical protein